MFRKLMATGNSPALLILRVSLGFVMLMHGLQQTVGVMGGKGMTDTLKYYTGSFHIPWSISLIGIFAISVGAVLLIAGLWGRVMALLIGIFQWIAMMLVHIHNGFFMNWAGTKSGEGFEYHILTVSISLAIVIYGSGWLSLDRLFSARKDRKTRDGK